MLRRLRRREETMAPRRSLLDSPRSHARRSLMRNNYFDDSQAERQPPLATTTISSSIQKGSDHRRFYCSVLRSGKHFAVKMRPGKRDTHASKKSKNQRRLFSPRPRRPNFDLFRKTSVDNEAKAYSLPSRATSGPSVGLEPACVALRILLKL